VLTGVDCVKYTWTGAGEQVGAFGGALSHAVSVEARFPVSRRKTAGLVKCEECTCIIYDRVAAKARDFIVVILIFTRVSV
jgi:hypothetical protein